MSSGQESGIILRPPSRWAGVARNLRALTRSGGERLNTPFRRMLIYELARTRGGQNRCRILRLLQGQGPLNANQIAGALRLHYTTVQHHLHRLVKDDIVAASPRVDSYGALFFLTYQMEKHAELLDEIGPLSESPVREPGPGVGPASLADVLQ